MHLAGEWFVIVNEVSTATCMHTYTHTHAILALSLVGTGSFKMLIYI